MFLRSWELFILFLGLFLVTVLASCIQNPAGGVSCAAAAFPSSFLWLFETVSHCVARASLELPVYPRAAFQSSSLVLIDGL